MTTAQRLAAVAELALAEATAQPGRTASRRAGGHLWAAITTPPAKTITSARNAIASFGTTAVQQSALLLLDELLGQVKDGDERAGQ